MGQLDHVEPLVLKSNVTLDMAGVERIDAAGIAALVTLYCKACESGHRFTLTNASRRVAQILSIVGLDRYLLSHNAVQNSQYGAGMERPAA
jgi:anti-anti-sigma factor